MKQFFIITRVMKHSYKGLKRGFKVGSKMKKKSYKFMDNFMSGLWKRR